MKKILALVLATLLIAASLTVAFADGNTITVSGAKNGETYNIYKMLDLSVGLNATTNEIDSYRYTINTKWSGFWTTGAGAAYIDTNTVGSDTYVVWKDNMKSAEQMEAFGKAAAAWAAANNITADKTAVTAENNTAQWTGLDNGYYMVTSTYGTAVSVASTPTNPAQTISEKNTDNTTDKDVKEAQERNGTAASWGNANDAQIGDTVEYRSKVTIVKNSTNVVYHDTMTSGLTWNGVSSVVVYTDAACTTALGNESNANYTVSAGTAPETFTVTFTQTYLDSLTAATTDLYIHYTATLNDNAVVGTTEQNTPKITWGNAGTFTGQPVDTDTHRFFVKKFDATDTVNTLAGAKFQVFTAATGGTALHLAVKDDDAKVYRVYATAADIPDGYTATTDDKFVTVDSGNIQIDGVDSDWYWIEETDPPTGYTALTARVKVEVNATNDVVSPVENKSGSTLPTTGGIGTTIFYVGGGLLVLAAVILLVTKRRMNSND